MSTPILPFAPWQAGTNQNSIPANDNSLRNQILNGMVISDSTDAQPGSPSDGDIYIMTGSASGAQWATFDQYDLAIFNSGTWYAYAPVEGIIVNIAGSANQWDGAAYVAVATGGGITEAPIDGNTYGRKDGDWSVVSGGGGGFDYFNVINYGATGDGITDDTDAVQDAIDAAEAVGGTVYFPRGTYILDPVYIAADNVRLLGEGRLSVLKRKAATVTNTDSIGIVNAHGTSMSHLSGIVLERLVFDGNKANITVGGGGDVYDVECTSFVFVDNGLIQQCFAYDSTSEGFDFDNCSDCVVLDCYAENCGGYGVHFSNGCVRMRGRGCFAVNCGIDLERGGFDCYSGMQYSSYEDCHARGCYRGFVIGSQFNTLTGCTATSCMYNGIRVTGNDNSISGCRVHGTTNGNAATIASTGNSISGGVYTGSESTNSGIVFVSGASNNAVAGASFRGNGGTGIVLNTGANNNTVVGCQTGVAIINSGTGNVLTANIV